MKNIENVVNSILEKYEECPFSRKQVGEIVINCAALADTYINAAKKNKNQSFEIELFDKAGELSNTIYGVTKDNMGETLADACVGGSRIYSLVSVNAFYYKDGEKVVNNIGKLDIC